MELVNTHTQGLQGSFCRALKFVSKVVIEVSP